MLKGKIYQLTWKQRKVLVYNQENLELNKIQDLPAELYEGWGLTTMNQDLIISDGTHYLNFMDVDFKIKKRIQVTGYEKMYKNINELEFFNGKIYANIWQKNTIIIINPKNGAVENYLDLTEITKSENASDVLNGIAIYNGNLLITGKYWRHIYEIKIKP